MKFRVIRGDSAHQRGRNWRQKGRKSLDLLPHLLTIGNLASGVVSVILTTKGHYLPAAWLVFLSMIFDAFDGRVARWLKAEGDFGKQLDSLADLVAFGVAPALLLFQVNLQYLGPWGWAIAALFPICGALRLARFNLLNIKGHFVGIPITASGGLLASFIVYGERLTHWAFAAAVLTVSLLMVSQVKYPDFKTTKLIRLRLAPIILPTIATILILRADPRSVIYLPLTLYAASGLYLHVLRKFEEVFYHPINDRPQERH